MTRNYGQAGAGNLPGPGLFLFLLSLITAAFAPACGEQNFSELRSGIETRGAYIEGVPFYEQKEFDCGPSALAGVFAFWGKTVDLDRITASIYLPQLKGTLPVDMERYAGEMGFIARSSSGTLEALKSAVRNNLPVICLVDLGFGIYRQPHYVTAIGFDDVHRVIIVHDGRTRDSVMPFKKFDRAWARAGRWMLVIKPKKDQDLP